MNAYAADLDDTGLEVADLQEDPGFTARNPHIHDRSKQIQGLQRLTHAFVMSPETLLQELVNTAVDLCGADSAGISIQREEGGDEQFYRWVATAGVYSPFLDALLPRHPSACGVCLDRGRPQLFRVSKRFFDILGIEAPLVTDGILLPWKVDRTKGTIFVMAHGRAEAFDREDVSTMQVLADFAAMAVRHQRHQHELLSRVKAEAAAEMANELAHEINNPLQALINVVYLAAEGKSGSDAKSLAQEISVDLQRLSALVQKLLELPKSFNRAA